MIIYTDDVDNKYDNDDNHNDGNDNSKKVDANDANGANDAIILQMIFQMISQMSCHSWVKLSKRIAQN